MIPDHALSLVRLATVAKTTLRTITEKIVLDSLRPFLGKRQKIEKT